MIIIDTPEGLDVPLNPRARHVLDMRRGLIDIAAFVIVQPGDQLSIIEHTIGFPIIGDHPPWEWALDHGQVFEAPIVTSDDGSAIVLIVADAEGIDQGLLTVLRGHAELAEALSDGDTNLTDR